MFGQKRYNDQGYGLKLVLFYTFVPMVFLIRIAEISWLFVRGPQLEMPLYQLFMADLSIRCILWNSYNLQTDDLRRMLRLMNQDY